MVYIRAVRFSMPARQQLTHAKAKEAGRGCIHYCGDYTGIVIDPVGCSPLSRRSFSGVRCPCVLKRLQFCYWWSSTRENIRDEGKMGKRVPPLTAPKY